MRPVAADREILVVRQSRGAAHRHGDGRAFISTIHADPQGAGAAMEHDAALEFCDVVRTEARAGEAKSRNAAFLGSVRIDKRSQADS